MLRIARSEAQAILWLTLLAPVFVAIAGLAIDGGVLLTSHRQLQSFADGAARAGATRLDTRRLRSSGGADVQLDPTLAAEAARVYLRDALVDTRVAWQAPPDSQVEVSSRRVHVVIRAHVQTAFLRIVRVDEAPVEASAFADVQFGIHDGGGG